MGCTTTRELAQLYRAQINAEFKQTENQTDARCKEHRRLLLRHLRKLTVKVHDRSFLVLKSEGQV